MLFHLRFAVDSQTQLHDSPCKQHDKCFEATKAKSFCVFAPEFRIHLDALDIPASHGPFLSAVSMYSHYCRLLYNPDEPEGMA